MVVFYYMSCLPPSPPPLPPPPPSLPPSLSQLRALRDIIRTTRDQLEEMQVEFADHRPSAYIEVGV